MQRFFSLLLVCCIAGQASVRTLWVLHYHVDKAAYLRNCENKDKPMMHCDGKCYLKKKMNVEKADAKEPKLPEAFREIKELHLYCEDLLVPVFTCCESSGDRVLPPFIFTLPPASPGDVFRPPSVV